jgi:hypothetical protein
MELKDKFENICVELGIFKVEQRDKQTEFLQYGFMCYMVAYLALNSKLPQTETHLSEQMCSGISIQATNHIVGCS